MKILAALLLACAAHAGAAPMKLADYLALDGKPPFAKFPYGDGASQYAELYLPGGAGPHPVVVLVHGGCWTVRFGGITQMRNVANALASEGIAVWNVEYRRVDEAGGGYPGTYQDMTAALNKLADIAVAHKLDIRRLAAVGHSAGGQLVQWMAGRPRLPQGSAANQPRRLEVGKVVSLGGLADLRHEAELIKKSCGRDTVQLAGTASAERPDVFIDTNAAELAPNGSTTWLVTGELDTISPPRVAHDYARRATAAGDRAEVVILPDASHYDEVAATSPAWPAVLRVIKRALGLASAQN